MALLVAVILKVQGGNKSSFFSEAPQFQTLKRPKYEFVVAALFQDEAPYLEEWLAYHRMIGVDHFYLYNNCSEDDYKEVLAPFIASGEVELINWNVWTKGAEEWQKLRGAIQKHALAKSRKEASWLLFLDLDDYLYPVERMNLHEIFSSLGDVGALAINRQHFGTSGVLELSDGLLIERLTQRAPTTWEENRNFQVALRPCHTVTFARYQEPILVPGFSLVMEDMTAVTGRKTPHVHVALLRINHYWSRDQKFLLSKKMERLSRNGSEHMAQNLEMMNRVEDRSILRFASLLKDRLTPQEVSKEGADEPLCRLAETDVSAGD